MNESIEKEGGFPTLALSRSGQGSKGSPFISAGFTSTPSTKFKQ